MANFKRLIPFLLIFLLGITLGYSLFVNIKGTQVVKTEEKNTPKAFLSEVYNKIKENYWENISDTQLLDLFGQIQAVKFKDEEELLKITQNVSQKDLVNIVSSVLASLQPAGRSGLFTQKQEIALKNTVENRNPETGKIEPTIFTKIVSPGILHFQLKKFSPTTLDEFVKAFDSYKDETSLYGLIFDLRGNVGGSIDATVYFLGHFLGKNAYAYDFYHRGEYEPFKTPTERLTSVTKYKQIVVLVDGNTQSSAEIMAASLKRYHVGVVVGVPTKGWGTVERVFPLENQIDPQEEYSMFLVHSITLRDDNLPIEGRGVEPDVNITDSGWELKLYSYFRNPQLAEAVRSIL